MTTVTSTAQASGTFAIGGVLPVTRLGYGTMQLTGPGVWGPPADPAGAVAVLRRAAELGVDLPPGPGTELSYRARMEKGTIAFSDRSEHLPQPFLELAAFTKDVAERVCGIER